MQMDFVQNVACKKHNTFYILSLILNVFIFIGKWNVQMDNIVEWQVGSQNVHQFIENKN